MVNHISREYIGHQTPDDSKEKVPEVENQIHSHYLSTLNCWQRLSKKTDMHFYPLDPLDNHISQWEKSPQDRLAFLLDSEFGDRTEAWDLRSCSVSHRQILWIPTQWSWHASRMGWVWWPNVARWNESDETITFGWKLGTPPSCSRPSVLPYQWNIWSQEFLWKLRNGCFLFAGVIGRHWPFGANGDHFGRFHLLCYRLSNSTVRKWG